VNDTAKKKITSQTKSLNCSGNQARRTYQTTSQSTSIKHHQIMHTYMYTNKTPQGSSHIR
jgi:hypothetical protein